MQVPQFTQASRLMRQVRERRSTVMAPEGQFRMHWPQKIHFIILFTIWLRSSMAASAILMAATLRCTLDTPSSFFTWRMISDFFTSGAAASGSMWRHFLGHTSTQPAHWTQAKGLIFHMPVVRSTVMAPAGQVRMHWPQRMQRLMSLITRPRSWGLKVLDFKG